MTDRLRTGLASLALLVSACASSRSGSPPSDGGPPDGGPNDSGTASDAAPPPLIPVDLFEIVVDRLEPDCAFQSTACLAEITFVDVPRCEFRNGFVLANYRCPEAECDGVFVVPGVRDDDNRVAIRSGGTCAYERGDCRDRPVSPSMRASFDREVLEGGLGCAVPVR